MQSYITHSFHCHILEETLGSGGLRHRCSEMSGMSVTLLLRRLKRSKMMGMKKQDTHIWVNYVLIFGVWSLQWNNMLGDTAGDATFELTSFVSPPTIKHSSFFPPFPIFCSFPSQSMFHSVGKKSVLHITTWGKVLKHLLWFKSETQHTSLTVVLKKIIVSLIFCLIRDVGSREQNKPVSYFNPEWQTVTL